MQDSQHVQMQCAGPQQRLLWPQCQGRARSIVAHVILRLRLVSWDLQVKAEKPVCYLAIISGSVLRTLDWVAARSAEYLGYLEKGQLPPARLTLTSHELSLVMEGD